MLTRRMLSALPLLGIPPAHAADAPVVAMLVHPNMVLLDLIGPLTVLNVIGAAPALVWKDRTPVPTDVGLPVTPTMMFDDCPPQVDVLFVPGGLGGSIAAMDDPAVMAFVADRGAKAKWVTSVCTGALVLGAAGLLRGYRATTHWYVRDLLPALGAIPAPGRVVVDRNRMTGGGVTAGIDFGLTLARELAGEETARRAQLVIEYDPHPPFDAGAPEGAGPALTQDVLTWRGPVLTRAKEASARAAARLGI